MFKNFTWGHGLVIALGTFMLFILSLIFIFTRGWQNAEMVSDNYYEDELVYQQVIDAKNNADALNEKPKFAQNANGIQIQFPKSITIDKQEVEFHLFRTDDAKLDVEKELKADGAGRIHIPNQILFPGSYTLKINWSTDGKPYQVDYDVLWK